MHTNVQSKNDMGVLLKVCFFTCSSLPTCPLHLSLSLWCNFLCSNPCFTVKFSWLTSSFQIPSEPDPFPHLCTPATESMRSGHAQVCFFFFYLTLQPSPPPEGLVLWTLKRMPFRELSIRKKNRIRYRALEETHLNEEPLMLMLHGFTADWQNHLCPRGRHNSRMAALQWVYLEPMLSLRRSSLNSHSVAKKEGWFAFYNSTPFWFIVFNSHLSFLNSGILLSISW